MKIKYNSDALVMLSADIEQHNRHVMEEVLYRTRNMDKEILIDGDLDSVREVIALERRV